MAAARLAALLPRLIAAVLVFLLGTATFTYAAERRISSAPASAAAPAKPPVLVVPNVQGQAYVFAKGILEEAGFAWRVEGAVRGYAANSVVEQRPLPGTRVIDTGAPLVVVRLTGNAKHAQGRPDDGSRYAATEVRLAEIAASRPKSSLKVVPKRPAVRKAKPAASARPPAFVVEGARKEPRNEISLPERARRLDAWLARRPAQTSANVQRWLYQNAWIVAGARLGWWHGAEALRILVRADERAVRIWGIGARSLVTARSALDYVEARSR